MNAKPTLAQPHAVTTTLAAVLAAIAAIGLLSAVATLFQRDGIPLEQLAAAERACVQNSYVSEREACMRDVLAAARTHIAAKQ